MDGARRAGVGSARARGSRCARAPCAVVGARGPRDPALEGVVIIVPFRNSEFYRRLRRVLYSAMLMERETQTACKILKFLNTLFWKVHRQSAIAHHAQVEHVRVLPRGARPRSRQRPPAARASAARGRVCASAATPKGSPKVGHVASSRQGGRTREPVCGRRCGGSSPALCARLKRAARARESCAAPGLRLGLGLRASLGLGLGLG